MLTLSLYIVLCLINLLSFFAVLYLLPNLQTCHLPVVQICASSLSLILSLTFELIRFGLLLLHLLGYSEKYCFSRAIQTKHTVHRVHRGEGKETVQNIVLQS